MNTPSTDSLELFIAKFLRYGVLLAGLLMLVGWLVEIDLSQNVFSRFATFHDLRLSESLALLYADGRWGALAAYSGMMVLISLPVIRVMMTLLVFVKIRDYWLATISAIVLVSLILSFTLGLDL